MNTQVKTKNIMRKFGIVANKRYGQNFLIDDNILENIVVAADITAEDLVIEIGPGLGNLTEYILSKARYAILVEIRNCGSLEDYLSCFHLPVQLLQSREALSNPYNHDGNIIKHNCVDRFRNAQSALHPCRYKDPHPTR